MNNLITWKRAIWRVMRKRPGEDNYNNMAENNLDENVPESEWFFRQFYSKFGRMLRW